MGAFTLPGRGVKLAIFVCAPADDGCGTKGARAGRYWGSPGPRGHPGGRAGTFWLCGMVISVGAATLGGDIRPDE
jgi:hypothetical protein